VYSRLGVPAGKQVGSGMQNGGQTHIHLRINMLIRLFLDPICFIFIFLKDGQAMASTYALALLVRLDLRLWN
jgi:hypothetical protein